jgi:hypothetical protein
MSLFLAISYLYLFVLTISLVSLAVFFIWFCVPLPQSCDLPYHFAGYLITICNALPICLGLNIIRETFSISALLYMKKKNL